MTSIVDQPPPQASNHRPAWERVIEFVSTKVAQNPNADPICVVVLKDMQERHDLGVKRYGKPLQAGNGRNHLVDAYQEKLDGIVYLQAWFDEHGWNLDELPEITPDHVRELAVIFINSIGEAMQLRRHIEAGF